jgi:nicotinamide-nucleotide amidase
MNAIILSIGDELTSGLTINTNAAYLGRQLSALAITCMAQITVGDDQNAIVGAIRQAIGKCDILLISGGLGPTEDDLTRTSLAEALGEPLVRDDAAVAELEAFFKRIQRTMTDNNRMQAMRPASAQCIGNSCGTAPGIMATAGGTRVMVMPGVPKEMKAMFETSFLPMLQAQAGGGIVRHIAKLNICGAGESWIGSQIADLMNRGANPLVGTTVHDGIVSVRIYATGPRQQVAEMISEKSAMVRQRLGALIFSQDDVPLEQVVADSLLQNNQSVATAESCTGGMLAMMLTNIPGSSRYFSRGWVTYSNESKNIDLGVDAQLIQRHGAVSAPVAHAMSRQSKIKADTTWGIGITGIAGPDGGSAEKPVGLVYIGISGPGLHAEGYVRQCNFSGDRQSIRLRSSQMALTLLRLIIQGHDPDMILPR